MREVEEIIASPDSPWKTESNFWTYLRGGIRRGLWNKHPLKLTKLKSERFKAPLGRVTKANPKGLVWACKCSLCGNTFRESYCEVDHINEASDVPLKEDMEGFIRRLVFILLEDLQIVCKDCHKIKSYSERQGISFEEAKATKFAISLEKEKKVIDYLDENGIIPAKNARLRRQQVIDCVTEVKESPRRG